MPLLKKTLSNDILVLELNDLKSRNAFSIDMAEALFDAIKAEDFSALVLTNAGPSFCSGGNLSFYKKLATKEEGLKVNARITTILDHVYNLPVPKAVFVNGPCYGGGIELVSCFDHVVCSPDALFGLWQRRVGLSFGWGGQKRLETKIKESLLLNWLLEGSTVTSYQAKQKGLVNQIKLSTQGLKACTDWAKTCNHWGQESSHQILTNKTNQPQSFKNLWLAPIHKKILNKFK